MHVQAAQVAQDEVSGHQVWNFHFSFISVYLIKVMSNNLREFSHVKTTFFLNQYVRSTSATVALFSKAL